MHSMPMRGLPPAPVLLLPLIPRISFSCRMYRLESRTESALVRKEIGGVDGSLNTATTGLVRRSSVVADTTCQKGEEMGWLA
jgi:hypothetical protein